MVVKERRGRRRYIAFEVISEGPVDPMELKRTIRSETSRLGIEVPKLIQYENKRGIVRCGHTDKETVIQLLQEIEEIDHKRVRVRSLLTSGTIKTLRDRFFKAG
jgi:RNase P/RNase MRP subunit POP5